MMDTHARYEVIYETLSASESESECATATVSNCGEQPTVNGKKRVTRNFIICNPKVSKKSSNKKSSSGFTEIVSDGLVSQRNENELRKNLNRCLIEHDVHVNGEKSILQSPSDDLNDSYSIKGSLRREKLKLSNTKWENAVNFIGKGGPPLKKIKQVIEDTIFKVLNEDFPCSSNNNNNNNNKNIAFDTNKKKCPHCEFETFSRFSLKKHVALHENKPQLVFSQGIPEKTADSFACKKFVCCECSDVFRTEIALKHHNCQPHARPVNSDNKVNELNSQNSNENFTEDSTLVTALKFLNQKPLDNENTRKEVIAEENSINKVADSNNAKDIKHLRRVLEEPVEGKSNCSSSVSSAKKSRMETEQIKIEPFEIVWEEVDADYKTELFDENNELEAEDSQCDSSSSNMYDDLERRMAILTGEEDNGNGKENSNAESLNGQNSNVNNNNNNQSVSEFDQETTWNSSSSFHVPITKHKLSDERQKFNAFVNKWLDSYKKIYPNLSARVHVPGGIPCPDCQLYYKSFHLLKRHWARIHDSTVPVLKCPKCDYKTAQRSLLISHLKHKHDDQNKRRKHQCDKCNKTYYSSSRLTNHKLYNHTDKNQLILYKCEKCPYTNFDAKNLQKHYERKHLNNDEKTYLCMYCGKLAKSKYAMQLHEKFHEGIAKTYKCNSCTEQFDHKYDLYSHKHIVHVSQSIYFNCKSCTYKTINKELLVIHENEIHRNCKKFKCSDCNIILKDLEDLRLHITRKHNPYVPWKYCAHCPYKSLKKEALSSHCVKHLPRKRGHIKCKLCNYRTYKKYYYDRHFNVKHNPNAVLYYCYHCGYSNKVKAKLHQHMQLKNHLLTS